MSITAIVHISNQEPIVCDIDELPNPQDTILSMNNPRKRDGRDLEFLDSEVTTIIFPWAGIIYVEIVSLEDDEEIIGFVRE